MKSEKGAKRGQFPSEIIGDPEPEIKGLSTDFVWTKPSFDPQYYMASGVPPGITPMHRQLG